MNLWGVVLCVVQVGTVKEGPGEYFSSRLTKKERKKTLVDELLVADEQFRFVLLFHPFELFLFDVSTHFCF